MTNSVVPIRHSSFVIRKSLIHSRGAGQYLLHPPSLARAQRTRFDDAHTIADLAGSIFIVRQKFRGFPLDFFIERVLHQPVDRNRNGFLHGRAGDGADLALADSSFSAQFPCLPSFDLRLTIYD